MVPVVGRAGAPASERRRTTPSSSSSGERRRTTPSSADGSATYSIGRADIFVVVAGARFLLQEHADIVSAGLQEGRVVGELRTCFSAGPLRTCFSAGPHRVVGEMMDLLKKRKHIFDFDQREALFAEPFRRRTLGVTHRSSRRRTLDEELLTKNPRRRTLDEELSTKNSRRRTLDEEPSTKNSRRRTLDEELSTISIEPFRRYT